MEAAGRELDFARLGIDDFHEAGLSDPAGWCAVMTEARTFSLAPVEGDSLPEIGELACLDLPSPDLRASVEFWQDFGFMCVESPDNDIAELHMPGFMVELRTAATMPTLNYRTAHLRSLADRFERTGITPRRMGDGLLLTAPEGTRLLFRDGSV